MGHRDTPVRTDRLIENAHKVRLNLVNRWLAHPRIAEFTIEASDRQGIDLAKGQMSDLMPDVLVETALPRRDRLPVEALRPVILGQPVEPLGKRQFAVSPRCFDLGTVPEALQKSLSFGLLGEDPGEALLAAEFINLGELNPPLARMPARDDLAT